MCFAASESSSYKCVSVHQRPMCPLDIMDNYGHGDNAAERNFPEQYKGNSGKRFLSWLGYTLARGGCQEGVSRRFSKVLEPLVFFFSKTKVTCLFSPKKCPKNRSLPPPHKKEYQKKKQITWAPPEAPALLVPASASDHCHPLGTHV